MLIATEAGTSVSQAVKNYSLNGAVESQPTNQPLDEALEEWQSLVWYFVHKLSEPWNRDDLFQVGQIALWNALETFEERNGCPFKTFCGYRIKWAMLKERSRLWKQRQPSFFTQFEDGSRAEDNIPIDQPTIEQRIIETEETEKVRAVFATLPSGQQNSLASWNTDPTRFLNPCSKPPSNGSASSFMVKGIQSIREAVSS